ncbi:SAM-dependent methyltransferase [Planomonospora sp. ID91781]|uniref:SAM-dependent methyltransferase n=1 Tax=Planomonospora sp. ID91781 TaxID=2738135 RepID=UPI0018C415C3|nr:SAM-dependent methyltransferase [Planomonospora sp. ID91781]MBG0825692.1 SAM-dependent methyltransferase [Planomonospora sp. ID91781]
MTGASLPPPSAEAGGELPSSPRGPIFDPSVPNAARIYGYLLDGKDNFPADRAAADRLIELIPGLKRHARLNRLFLRRSVHDLARAGVRQFVDLGSGLPTQDNVHEVVHRVAPDARVVYVDMDPVTIAHARALLATDPDGLVQAVEADVRRIEDLLSRPELAALDRSKPIAVTAVALFHFMPGMVPAQIITALREWMPPGSYLVISHATPGTMSPEDVEKALALYQQANLQMFLRSPEEVARLFKGFQLSEEGIVPVGLWRPEIDDDEQTPTGGHFVGGLGWLAH